jgi:hypothetical protein
MNFLLVIVTVFAFFVGSGRLQGFNRDQGHIPMPIQPRKSFLKL